MDALDRLLERAGNAGDMEAEAIGILAREVRALRELVHGIATDLTAIVAALPKNAAPAIDTAAIAKQVAEAVTAAIVTVRVSEPVAEKRQRKAV